MMDTLNILVRLRARKFQLDQKISTLKRSGKFSSTLRTARAELKIVKRNIELYEKVKNA